METQEGVLPEDVLQQFLDATESAVASTAAPVSAVRADSLALHGIRVLVVDPSRAFRKSLVHVLVAAKAMAHQVESGNQALLALRTAAGRQHPYSVLMANIELADMNGLDLVERMRQQEEIAQTAAIMMSTATPRETIVRCARLGVSQFILKSASHSRIRAAVQDAYRAANGKAANSHTAAPAGAALSAPELGTLQEVLLQAAWEGIEQGTIKARTPEEDPIFGAFRRFCQEHYPLIPRRTADARAESAPQASRPVALGESRPPSAKNP